MLQKSKKQGYWVAVSQFRKSWK